VKGHEFQVEVATRLRPWDEMVMPILAAHEGGAVLAVELHHVMGIWRMTKPMRRSLDGLASRERGARGAATSSRDAIVDPALGMVDLDHPLPAASQETVFG